MTTLPDPSPHTPGAILISIVRQICFAMELRCVQTLRVICAPSE